jgi:hypothetical protein
VAPFEDIDIAGVFGKELEIRKVLFETGVVLKLDPLKVNAFR